MSDFFSKRTAAEVLQSVVMAHHFTAEDLETNRKLQLSASQQQSLKIQTRVFAGALLVSLVLIASALAVKSVFTYFLAVLGLILGGGAAYLLFKFRDPGIVTVAEGVMSREARTYGQPGHRSTSYYYHIGDKTFTVDREEYEALTHDIPVRAYYLPGANLLLNLELLADQLPESEKQIHPPLPHTGF